MIGISRAEVENKFKKYDYVIYNSSSNNSKEGIEKFRLILNLEKPIYAKDLKYWRKFKKWKKIFEGCDESTFAIGRFFYMPNAYDKGGEKVEIKHNKGIKIDFYKLFRPYHTTAAFEKLREKMFMHKYENNSDEPNIEAFKSWMRKRAEKGVKGGLHYCDVPAAVLVAKKYNIPYHICKDSFRSHYAGESIWEKNLENLWKKM